MAKRYHHLEMKIHLTDAVQVKTFQNTVFNTTMGCIKIAPDQAAVTYSAPLVRNNDPIPPGQKCITSQWFSAGTNYPTNFMSFERKSGGWFGISALFGDTDVYEWYAIFDYVPPTTGVPGETGTPASPDPIAQRRWIEGFEFGTASLSGSALVSRAASRSTQGLGLAHRDHTVYARHNMSDYTGLTPTTSWERFYFRPRVFPASQRTFWRARQTVASEAGCALALLPSGQIALFQVDSVAAFTLLGTPSRASVIDEWMKIDILTKWGAGAAVYLFINGQAQLTVTGISADMGTAGRTHASSEVGAAAGGTIAGAYDIDDWMCADWPASAPSMATPGADWRSGSRIALVRPTGFGTGNVWTGDYKTLLQSPQNNATTARLTSIVSGAQLAVATDYDDEVRGDPLGQIGVVAMVVGLYSLRGTTSGQLGYAIKGLAAAMTATTQGVSIAWQQVMYRPAALPVGEDIFPLELVHTKGADVTSSSVGALQAQVEVLGVFGPEDLPAQVTSFEDLAFKGAPAAIHNAPYPRTPWAQSTIPAVAPIGVYAGTYTGNAAGVEISFKTPVHWWWSHRVSTSINAGAKWFAALGAAHQQSDDVQYPEVLVQALQDPAFVAVPGENNQETSYLVRITGSNANANTAGETYAYVAISDPGGRFLVTGGLKQHKGTVNVDTTIPYTNWTPECGFVLRESSSGTTQLYYKGPGHAAATYSNLAAAETANAITFSTSHLVTQSALHDSGASAIAYAVLRREDGNARDPERTLDQWSEVFQLASYTGDGSASRTVGLSPVSGKRPVFALVVPHNAASLYRDHSHTGTTSTMLPASANATTGITGGGIDQISVGSVLNASGVVYDVFVVPGGTTAGNGGFSTSGEFFPRPPATNPGGPGENPEPGTIEPGPGPDPGGGVGPPPTPVWPVGCDGATTAMVNIALARLGISKLLINVATEQRVEAEQARLHYSLAVDATLRAFPWPFATHYQRLAPLTLDPATVPVSPGATTYDWQYAYRVPPDFLFARRLVKNDGSANVATAHGLGRRYDDQPIEFRLSNDNTAVVTGSTQGTVLLTNAAPADFVLEYTRLPVCPSAAADPLFRTALAWRLAAEMAAALSRDDKKTQWCMAMFERTIREAEVAAANEQQQEVQRPDAPWIEGR